MFLRLLLRRHPPLSTLFPYTTLFRSGLQHLDVKPGNLFLVSNHVKVADFGLVNSLTGVGPGKTATLPPGAITPLYASPELFQGTLSRHCDQYSLALVYQELLTGTLPFNGKNTRQLLLQHTGQEPDLTPLPAEDQPVVARALAKDPNQRFPSCTDFVRALTAAAGSATPSAPTPAGPAPRGETPPHGPQEPGEGERVRDTKRVASQGTRELAKVAPPDPVEPG